MLFHYSLKEEVSQIITFADEYIEFYFSEERPIPEINIHSAIDLFLLGFEQSINALKEIFSLCSKYKILDDEFYNFNSSDGYNLFADYGVNNFKQSFESMYKTFLELIK